MRLSWVKSGVTAAIALIALVLALGGFSSVAGHASPVAAAAPAVAPVHAPAAQASSTGPANVSITTTFTSTFETDGLPYFALPYNITWNVTITNATIGADFTQVINISYVQSDLCPLFFPCLLVYQDVVNPLWVANLTATTGSYYYPMSQANLTDQNFLGFSLPQGQWIMSVWDNYNDGEGNTSNFEVDQAGFIAVTPPAGSISQPVSGSNVASGHTVIAGDYSGYFVATANVTVYNGTGVTVLTAPVYAPGVGDHPFAVQWAALTPGSYTIDLVLTAVWHETFTFTATVNITAGVPVTYFNQTSPGLIPGLSNGGSAALLITLGAIIGMIVMALVGRGLFGGNKPAPAQPWSPTSSGGTSGGTGGSSSSGGGSSDMSGGSSGGMGGSSPPSS